MVRTNPNRPPMNRRTCIYVQYLLNHTLKTVNEVLGILKILWKMIISPLEDYHPPEDFFSSLKVFFFRKCDSFFRSPNLKKKKIFQKTILSLKFKFPAHNTLLLWAGNLNFKLRILFLEYFFGDLKKRIALSEKKHL